MHAFPRGTNKIWAKGVEKERKTTIYIISLYKIDPYNISFVFLTKTLYSGLNNSYLEQVCSRGTVVFLHSLVALSVCPGLCSTDTGFLKKGDPDTAGNTTKINK